jgi:Arylsulfotransferase (ASST)
MRREAIKRTAALCVAAASVGAVAAGSSPVAAAPADLQISGDPDLFPAFDPAVRDYVSRCGETGSLTLSIAAPDGQEVSVDGGPPRSGAFDATVALAGDQSTTVTATSPAGAMTYHVRCLPEAFPRWRFERSGSPQARWYLVGPVGRWMIFFDPNGTPVWWMRTGDQPFNPTLLRNGHVVSYPLGDDQRFGTQLDKSYVERRLDGEVVRRHRTVGTPTDLHEFQELPNGNLLLEAYRPRRGVDLRKYGGPKRARVFYAEVQEVTRGGRLVWRWNSRGRISLDETDRWPDLVRTQRQLPRKTRWYDAFHINSMSPDPRGPGRDDDGLVISCRHDDAVYRIDRSTGRVAWKLGGTHTAKSLEVVGDSRYRGRRTFGGQHDARVLPDGTVTVYDNGAERARPPRAVRYRIDLKKRTATLVEELEDPAVPRSRWGGGTRRLAGGNWATAWGGTPAVSEMTPAGARVFALEFNQKSNYRVFPVRPDTLSARALRAGMDRMHPRK